MELENKITFQVYRLNFEGRSLAEFQGPRLHEFSDLAPDAISGDDTVADVQAMVFSLHPEILQAGETASFYFAARPMDPNNLFYADHFMSLPSWVQILVHNRDTAAVVAKIQELVVQQRAQQPVA
eukprot:TRINITY_DN15210_c0_g1_i1.p1 TRINITY_DN15210_c0_g1~~TRINITY_DN15210_c0_g1_i1.p1  ORF type:complete len:125 (+),score=38.97 TRINITY_DN15210_c0_g1_i1:105-479(+)